mmetsp:Transcript_23716/g.40363  ORF Transcript_23716/g.40363 Transcript_23716/m.40363 type:complete len:774 (+) Transcript_23716:195-2516(+)
MDISITVKILSELVNENDSKDGSNMGCLRMYERPIMAGYVVVFSSGDTQIRLPADKLSTGDCSKLEFLLNTSENTAFSVMATHTMDYTQFVEAMTLSKEIVHMKLQLNMCLREVFCDGVMSDESMPDDFNINKLDSLLAEASACVIASLDKGPSTTDPPPKKAVKAVKAVKAKDSSSQKAAISTNKDPSQPEASTSRLNYCSSLTCVYCDKPGSLELSQLQVHPYVPVTMDRKVLYFCEDCHDNWLKFRHDASRLKLLVLAGEYNEEVCAVCSDSPAELVLCSSCPRSYCYPCLLKLLTPKQSAEMATNEYWKCLCCVHSKKDFGRFTKALNLTISSQNCPLPLAKDAKCALQRATKPAVTATSAPAPAVNAKKEGKSQPQSNSKRQRYIEEENPAEEPPVELGANGMPKRNRPSRKKLESEYQNMTKNKYNPPLKKQKIVEVKKECVEESPSPYRATIHRSPQKIEEGLPPISSDLDEVYYFSQYVNMRRNNQSHLCPEEEEDYISDSEDFCFLCKDGGDVIECDHGRQSVGYSSECDGNSCKKVYHSYCLGYEIPDDQEAWLCARHFCVKCGTGDVMYRCQYCPLACCKKCFLQWNDRHQLSQYAEKAFLSKSVAAPVNTKQSRKSKKGRRNRKKSSSSTNSSNSSSDRTSVVTIACGFCLRMFEKCFQRQLLEREKCYLGNIKNVSELQKASVTEIEPVVISDDEPSPPPLKSEEKNDCVDISNSDTELFDEKEHPVPIKSEIEIENENVVMVDMTEISSTDVGKDNSNS